MCVGCCWVNGVRLVVVARRVATQAPVKDARVATNGGEERFAARAGGRSLATGARELATGQTHA